MWDPLRAEKDLEVGQYYMKKGDMDAAIDRFQDALLTEELDPGLFRKQGPEPEKKEARIEQFSDLLRRAIGSEKAQHPGKKS